MRLTLDGVQMPDGGRSVNVKMSDGSEKNVLLDEDGFLTNPGDWCEEFVAVIAPEESIAALTSEHWKVIRYLRDYYLKFDSCPPIRMLCKSVGLEIKQIYDLFPTGPAKGACRLAGAPKPTGCV
jgi:tRNA 2-thiouridine synthesizing protein E